MTTAEERIGRSIKSIMILTLNRLAMNRTSFVMLFLGIWLSINASAQSAVSMQDRGSSSKTAAEKGMAKEAMADNKIREPHDIKTDKNATNSEQMTANVKRDTTIGPLLNKVSVTHHAHAIVKAADSVKGTVTLSHEPVKSLKWPAMTMMFSVTNKALFPKFVVGNQVNVEFVQQGSLYVVTAVK